MVYLLLCFVALSVSILIWIEVRKARLSRMTWEELAAGLQPISAAGITVAATMFCDPSLSDVKFGQGELWSMVGGWRGLRRMQANASLLIALAEDAQSWDCVHSAEIAEHMRRDALQLRRAVLFLAIRRLFGLGDQNALFTLEASYAYYAMSERLLSLYEVSPSRRYAHLAAAVWNYA